MSENKRYAIVGTGGRAMIFVDAICDTYKEHAKLVGLCDVSRTRMAWHNRRLGELFNADPVPTYEAAHFDQMIREQRPDVVIVATIDAKHHEYVIRAMQLGCDVICEKPLTTRAEYAQRILEAVDATGRKLTVTFNLRYLAASTQIKRLIHEGVIGRPTAVDLRWMLDTSHGADYFRRWHATKANSGGLLVHKSTHHFDLVNWWLEDQPETVAAMGGLMFYGRANAQARGQSYSYDRYTGQAQAVNDPFALRLDDPEINAAKDAPNLLKGLYMDAEAESGYIRDRNVFGDHVDIEDTVGVLVRYRRGAVLSYSLVAYSPWEGYDLVISGTKGQLRFLNNLGVTTLVPATGRQEVSSPHGPVQTVIVHPHFSEPYAVDIPPAAGGHGGADPQLMAQLFSPKPPADPYHHAASHIDGCASLLVGASANEAFARGQVVHCDELLPLPTPAHV